MTGELIIPVLDPDTDMLTAALAYAKAALYTLPTERGSKHPGSVVGNAWPSRSTLDPKEIAAYWAGTDHGIALHLGRSGIMAFDVDNPAAMPPALLAAIAVTQPPYQSTRADQPGRGHYLFRIPEGRDLGNGKGQLTGAWGEVRGRNGVIIAAPSVHEKHKQGARYLWERTGAIPVLPDALAAMLPDALSATDAATDHEVRAFLAQHAVNARPQLLGAVERRYTDKTTAGESRHDTAVGCLVQAMKEARAGYYPAGLAATRLGDLFVASLKGDRPGRSELAGIMAWAVAQARAADLEQVRAITAATASGPALLRLVAPPASTPPSSVNGTTALAALPAPVDAPDAQPAEEPAPRTSWFPRDVAAILSGDLQAPEPTVLVRDDNHALFYPGKINGLAGESESGKTWVALHAVAQNLEEGHAVLYLDFEDSAQGVLSRLLAMGVTPARLSKHLAYVDPSENFGATAAADLAETLAAHQPDLVIVDGVNAAMTLMGLDLEKNKDATTFSQRVLRPLKATGACVVTVDHVTKNKETRGSYAIGAQAKRADIDGCLILVDVLEPFGKGMDGRLRLIVGKDRPGSVRGVSLHGKGAGIAHLSSNTATGAVRLRLAAPDLEPSTFLPTALMERVSRYLESIDDGAGAAKKTIEEDVDGRREWIREALERLVEGLFVARVNGLRGAVIHRSIRPYRAPEETESNYDDVAPPRPSPNMSVLDYSPESEPSWNPTYALSTGPNDVAPRRPTSPGATSEDAKRPRQSPPLPTGGRRRGRGDPPPGEVATSPGNRGEVSCSVCEQPMSYDDGSGTHPSCTLAGDA